MFRIILIVLFAFFTIESTAQINFKKLKDRVKKAVEEEVDPQELANKDDRMAKIREDQLVKDTSFYNYIFSQGNRASFFANRDSKENLLVTFAKNYEDEDTAPVELEVYEKVFDLNRTAEFSIYIHPEAAIANFNDALGLMMDDVPSFVQVFTIEDLVNMDTMNIAERYALGKTIANISILIHAEGDYKLSEKYIEETIRYFKEIIGENTVALASLYCNHATISQAQGRYTEAEDYFDKAEEVIKKNDRVGSLSHALILNNKALLFNEIGQYDKALETIDQAIRYAEGALREKGRDNVSFQINKGLIQYSAGSYVEAERVFREIIELKRKRLASNQTDVGNVKNYLAAVLMEQGKPGEVLELLAHSLDIFRKKYSESHPAYIKTKHNKGRYHLTSGSLDEAQRIIGEVSKSYLQIFNEYHPDYLSSLEDLAVIFWKKGDFAKAKVNFEKVLNTNLELVEKYFGAMSEYEKSQYWAKVRPSILKFYAFASERGKEDPSLLTDMYNLHLKTKGILLSASSKVREEILNSNDESLKNLYTDWVDAKEKLLLYYSYSKEQLKDSKIDLNSAEEKANQLEKELNRRSASFAASNKLPTTTLAEVKSNLGADDAAIEIIGYPVFDRSFKKEKKYAFLIADLKSIHPRIVEIKNGEDLEGKYAKAYLNMVKAKLQDRISYDKYWKPVDEALVGFKNIHLSLDGIYFQLNIGALKRPDGTFVSDNLDLHLYTSTRDLVKEKHTGFSSKNVSLIGYPDFGNKGLLSPLPGTKAELEAISEMTRSKGFNTKAFMQKQATEENFKSIHSPALLHVATHGFFLPESQASGEKVFGVNVSQAKENPLLRSGLMLANAEQTMQGDDQSVEVKSTNNGVLTAYEVITLDLKNTDLVVLSACETGLGEIKSGEGVYGLQRAFQVAGAESVIMSLWKVSDEATMQLMTNFYKEWMGGKPKEVAFFAAQKKLRESFPEPYYWGAFVMLN
ncbi:CHAT domain-containing tetratricopeptide repeat protein [Ekhidna sp. MALMAid0563]|uniref:CHAT domain-containing protein n=1 Tax=Ekhidna sp. MALMAid0563 TaxID=3143937 RepID=UPI0032DE5C6D